MRYHAIVATQISIVMKLVKVSISFSRYSDADFLNKATFIVASMTGNVAFPNPVPTLAEVQAALDKYSADLVAAAWLGRNNVAEKNKSREALEQLLAQLGMFVMFIANGDVAILTGSGYTLNKEPEPRYIDNPGNVTLSNGITSGNLVAAVKNVANNGYLFQITDALPAENTMWTSHTSSKRQFTFSSLLPGKQYWVRVAALGKRNQSAWSTVATQFVQ